MAGRDVLIAAPTGSGKTLTAFLVAIDRLLRLAVRNELTDEIRVVYVSPLRALSNDMHRDLGDAAQLPVLLKLCAARPKMAVSSRWRSKKAPTASSGVYWSRM